MIHHGLYASLPQRRGEGGTGIVTDRRQELRFVRRNLELIANLVRLRANLPIDPEAHTRLLHQRAKLRARLANSPAKRCHPKRSAQHRHPVARDLQFARSPESAEVSDSGANPTNRATGASASDGQSVSDQRKRTQQSAPPGHPPVRPAPRYTACARKRPAMSMFTLIIIVMALNLIARLIGRFSKVSN